MQENAGKESRYSHWAAESLCAVPWMAAALPHWIATDTRCKRCWWDSGFEVATAIRLPRSLKKWPSSDPIAPNVSTALETKKWLGSRWAYFSLFLHSISSATAQLPSLQVLHRMVPGCQGMWRPRPTLYHSSRGQWMFYLGICHLICRCPMVLGERESLLLPVTSWQHRSKHRGVGGGPCWNDN